MMSAGPDLADWLRWGGLGFELTGLGITAAGIADLRRRYSDRPGVVAAARATTVGAWNWFVAGAVTCALAFVGAGRWLRRTTGYRSNQLLNVVRRIRGRPQIEYGSGRDVFAFAGLASGEGTASGTRVATSPANVDERFAALEHQTQSLERSLVQLTDDVDGRIRDLASGGLRAEAVGVAVLSLGLILSSISAGLADLIRNVVGL
jgi:hypothetical protein